jgi:curved DNA-binding protein CbpA
VKQSASTVAFVCRRSDTKAELIVTNEAPPTFYEVLGVASSASPTELRDAYRSIARRLHPDTPDAPVDADELMSVLNEAYDTLRNPAQRRTYDATLNRSSSSVFAQPEDSYSYLPPEEQPTPSSPLSAAIALLFALGVINIGLGFATTSPGAMAFGVVFLFVSATLSGFRFRQAMRHDSHPRR